MSAAAGLTGNPGHQRWRKGKDWLARYIVAIGGVSVIGALLLIFFYLAYVVLPLFRSAEIEEHSSFAAPGGGQALYLYVEEQGEIGLRLNREGRLTFFSLGDGALKRDEFLALPAGAQVAHTVEVDGEDGLLALGLSDGSVLMLQHKYPISYAGGQRTITPELSYPLGAQPLMFASRPMRDLAVRMDDDGLLLVGLLEGNELTLQSYERQTSFVDESTTLVPGANVVFSAPVAARHALVNPLQEWLYVLAEDGQMGFYDIRNPAEPKLLQMVDAAPHAARVQAAQFIAGGISLIVAADTGDITQWFPLRDEDNNYTLQRVRHFRVPSGSAPSALTSELRRRGFASGDAQGRVALYYSTSDRVLADRRIADAAIERLAIDPRAKTLIAESADGRLHTARLHNEHPEISWGALWGEVWYESYPEPDYVWQSSSASNDFEPKFSLVPLVFGTIKAAFYAMLFAIPFALMGAIYTAYFMAPGMRQLVKPGVEIIQALPTVILGFLAGLWLAPMVEAHLAGIFGTIVFSPFIAVAAGFAWTRLPARLRHRFGDGWQAALLVPVVALSTWLCFSLGDWMELTLFGGSLPLWLDHELGVDYDQRNSIVVGIAMGFAVIPVIFSIAEDAIFSVPKQLSNGSLALGATTWQTLVRVILPTASPGIFSAVMIGFGRAVGETMIVLMATGNTPVLDFSIFQGLRTLSANIAVEMPESEVGSSHYRILFLAGLVLFIFTFVFNTLAEMVRQRLREKYSNI